MVHGADWGTAVSAIGMRDRIPLTVDPFPVLGLIVGDREPRARKMIGKPAVLRDRAADVIGHFELAITALRHALILPPEARHANTLRVSSVPQDGGHC